MNKIENWPGNPYPLGATYDGQGVNFALFSENATGVELCLFENEEDKFEKHRIKFTERTHHSWHAYIPGIKPGQLYGYRVHGPFDPENGHRFNANKLLIDPYSRAINRIIRWHHSLYGYRFGHKNADLSFNEADSAPYIPRSVVIDLAYDWEGDKQLKIPFHKTIIYELHVKGFTRLNPHIPQELRGTYAGLGSPGVIDYLLSLGVNAVELMPVHQFVSDQHLVENGLTNYWGYNTIGFFAPDIRYAKNMDGYNHVNEFKDMVKALHKAGIEVILDVVYNHTAEGNHMGPTLSFRGIDNYSYYRLLNDEPRYYMDYTGTGNTLNTVHPNILRLLMDSLRYWALEMHVDGFRFDLASALAREFHDVDKLGSFFDVLHQDPVLSQMKLIAEPWDVGEGGYQVGEFPTGWAEWNGKYRDCIRDFWRGQDNTLPEFANRITGSSDLYMDNWRNPMASINFITAHDGFTLNDLVSYNEKHNFSNGENNMDGESHNRSWNCGVEGPTDDPEINKLRRKQRRNFLTTLFLSQGVPMLLAGDECGRTQQGNNNAYCQDNEISWFDWEKMDEDLLDFTRNLIRFSRSHPSFLRRKWFQGIPIKGKDITDISWFLPEGSEMSDEHWAETFAKSLGVFLHGEGIHSLDMRGNKIYDDSFYLMFNAHYEPVDFCLPEKKFGEKWIKILDTSLEKGFVDPGEMECGAGEKVTVDSRSVIMCKVPKKKNENAQD
jgi:glycogen operon protein